MIKHIAETLFRNGRRCRRLFCTEHNEGFSLLELTIVLSIMSIIIGGSLAIATGQYEAFQEQTTRRKMEAIATAIESFVYKQGRLPCPSDPAIAPNDPNFGKESRLHLPIIPGPGITMCTISSSMISTGTAATGSLPITTLNLPKQYFVDGWNRRFTYVVSLNSITDQKMVASPSGNIAIGTPNSDVTDAQTYRANPAKSTGANVVVISHGANGHGARLDYDGTIYYNNGADHPGELANCMCDTNAMAVAPTSNYFVQGSTTKLKNSGTSSKAFDDLVWYMSRPHY